MTYPVSIVPYANMTPFRTLGPPRGCRFVTGTPSLSTGALADGSILAAPLPVGDLPSVAEIVEPVGEYGVAAAGAVRSVLLFSNSPLDEIKPPSRLFLTEQSSSSVRLLFLLLGYRNGFEQLPYRTTDRGPADAELLIGDAALMQASENPGRHVTDLAEEWYRTHRLPFVFARWVVRTDAPAEVKQAMRDWLSEFASREEELVEECAGPEAKRLGTSREDMLDYLKGMRRVLGPREIEGQALFLEDLARRRRDPLFPEAVEVLA